MRGYYRAPDLTAKAIDPEGWFNTGDLARFEGDAMFIVGRTKEMIIRSGFNVYPAEIEAVLSTHPDVVQCAVVGRSVPGNEEIVAFVQLLKGSSATAQDLMSHVLGGTCDVPHYFCTAVMMPSVLRYNRPATEAAQRLVAAALGAPQRDAGDAFATFIAELGLPRRLADVGVAEDRFELIGKNAMLSIFTRANPQPIREPADIVKILKLAA